MKCSITFSTCFALVLFLFTLFTSTHACYTCQKHRKWLLNLQKFYNQRNISNVKLDKIISNHTDATSVSDSTLNTKTKEQNNKAYGQVKEINKYKEQTYSISDEIPKYLTSNGNISSNVNQKVKHNIEYVKSKEASTLNSNYSHTSNNFNLNEFEFINESTTELKNDRYNSYRNAVPPMLLSVGHLEEINKYKDKNSKTHAEDSKFLSSNGNLSSVVNIIENHKIYNNNDQEVNNSNVSPAVQKLRLNEIVFINESTTNLQSNGYDLYVNPKPPKLFSLSDLSERNSTHLHPSTSKNSTILAHDLEQIDKLNEIKPTLMHENITFIHPQAILDAENKLVKVVKRSINTKSVRKKTGILSRKHKSLSRRSSKSKFNRKTKLNAITRPTSHTSKNLRRLNNKINLRRLNRYKRELLDNVAKDINFNMSSLANNVQKPENQKETLDAVVFLSEVVKNMIPSIINSLPKN